MTRILRSFVALGLGSALAACTSTTPLTAEGSSVTASIRVRVVTPSPCPETDCGIPMPDCEGDAEVVGTYDPSTGVVVSDVETDVDSWAQALVGGGDATSGIPTPPNTIAFLIRRDGRDLALLWYRTAGADRWIRSRYVACEWALNG